MIPQNHMEGLTDSSQRDNKKHAINGDESCYIAMLYWNKQGLRNSLCKQLKTESLKYKDFDMDTGQ